MRNYYASQDSMIELVKTRSEIYTASIAPEAAGSSFALSEEEILQRFSIITQAWSN